MKVIINADDFGLTSGGNKAIIECHKNGILTSTTLMANTRYTEEAIALAKENPSLGVGVHMVLTTQSPLLKTHKTLVNEEGRFKYSIDTIDEAIDLDEVFAEWDAQIEAIKQHLDITHLDSHHHVHMHPILRPVTEKLAAKHGVPYRSRESELPTQVKVNEYFYKDGVTRDFFVDLFTDKDYEAVDVMTHPAYVDDYLESISSYTHWRKDELDIMCDPSLKALADANGIELVNYRNL
ncbi:chitin disaccharide deacetylase [Erysipelothrix sp. HDW6C]|uniref:chitin disaccharide deacetylase n=1 Tax=Erysipelothrix sp. HDW6C TaxID=2714930 RepID=UPI00140E35AA|nr:chitin disaccharide deacetylase [Erysipelothrix sp. HDW6C]QIK70518.1 chitin disaccharide deacetylase [Erysipelothrix sp. HDW6C]